MDHQTATEVIACLPHDRTLFHYYRDRYAVGLLRQFACGRPDSPPSIAELKLSPFAQLARKPRVKDVLANLGGDRLDANWLALFDYDPGQIPFVLTLGLWGTESGTHWRRKQISRRGFNLVLQLNFNRRHDARFNKLESAPDLFCYRGHPVSTRRNTLAWARLDFDLASGVALIEEIQSDWIREVNWLVERIQHKLDRGASVREKTGIWGLECSIEQSLAYCGTVLEEYRQIWAEAMLWAAILFLRDEIGIRQIYYHTVMSGRLFKHLNGSYLPPQSLYSDLPRKFCFGKTREFPVFLEQGKTPEKLHRRYPELFFYRLAA